MWMGACACRPNINEIDGEPTPYPSPGSRRRDKWRRRALLIRPRLPHPRRTPIVVLKRQPNHARAEVPLGDLGDLVIAGANAECAGIQRITQPQRHRRVVTVELLAERDIRHLYAFEAATLDLHPRAVEVGRLENRGL